MLQDDSIRHKGLRRKLVEVIAAKGITDSSVLDAMLKVPRHFFMDSGFLSFAYKDQAFPIGSGQTISQPFTVAFQTQLLQVRPMQKVLEVGTGSGYQAAILMEMGARLYTIERHKDLFLSAKALLEAMGYRPSCHYGDGYQGLPAYSPFDRILVTAGTSEVPQALVEQLAPGGRLVIPVGDLSSQTMMLIEKMHDGTIKESTHGNFIFVPLLKGKA